MSKEIDKFVKEFKATKAKLKELSLQNGEKMKKTLIANLDKTWKAEDLVQEAVGKARSGGETSKKAADYIKMPDVAKPFKVWHGMLKDHAKQVEKFDKYHNEVKKLEMDLGKRLAVVEKELKKAGGKADKAVTAVVDEAKKTLPQLKKAVGLMGSMQGHVIMYGANEKRTIEGVVKQGIAAVDPKEFPDPLNEKNRAKTIKALKDHDQKLKKLHEAGMKAMEEGDVKKAEGLLKKAQPLMKTLKKFEDEARMTGSKMRKEVKQAKDKKQLEDLMKQMQVVHKRNLSRVEELEQKIKEGPEEEKG